MAVELGYLSVKVRKDVLDAFVAAAVDLLKARPVAGVMVFLPALAAAAAHVLAMVTMPVNPFAPPLGIRQEALDVEPGQFALGMVTLFSGHSCRRGAAATAVSLVERDREGLLGGLEGGPSLAAVFGFGLPDLNVYGLGLLCD